ncbi:Iron permease [Georgfuchsia toluolica]|uniref:Iron permease n=1 Tax=Georgfuchsia toluolica TaxID=424218 RepID=A0A916J4W2_9PROT|nr:FTR1 family protein [Georgfuchsia toluolica]CAG4884043.1 Iron permease [Georgfuchsia toluolica]
MFGAAIIVFRETLEAAMIISIIAIATRAIPSRRIWLLTGIGAGILGSLIVASLTGQIAELAQGAGQELFNAGILGLAALMLAWHNIWMARHGKQLAMNAKQLSQDVISGNREMSALALVVALATLREGSETALFLYGLVAGSDEPVFTVLSGGAIGLLVGAATGYAFYAGFLRIPAKLFFSMTSGLILLMAAAMTSQAVRFLVQADVLPSLASPLWDTSRVLDNASLFGRVLHTLIGYEAMPSGIQVIFYFATATLIYTGMRFARVQPPSDPTPSRKKFS